MRTTLWMVFLLAWVKVHAGNVGKRDSTVQWLPGGIGIHAGITGVGGHLAWKLPAKARLVLRVGGTYLAYKKSMQLDLGDSSIVELRPDFVIGLVQTSIKWHPFRRGAFFVTGGAGYTWRPDIRLQLTAKTLLDLGGIRMKAEEFGTIQLGVKWSPIVGYAGFGFGRSIPRRRFGFGVEMGCYYLGSPKVEMEFEGFLETTTLAEQTPLIEKNMRGYRFLPNLQLVFTYSLFKKPMRP